ncbi:type VI secretion protein ImpB [Sandaracinobacter neustonicus]|uniref:DNA-directed DNA polymerase n=1 Tax=Sandaracinobacter neustonicus TaxID=1715348 RepID=A0A501XD10_9SPHN|nr:type VI secretion protein ImpB [Sandaracinobacter neustonicus]TPE58451.1 type VI secretion protein ImpB [Sandaracinobacter neustonicus]
MRRPDTIEHMYLDFDGFFASVEQQIDSRLRGRPVGVIPYVGGTRAILIACSREAKARGVKNIMPVDEAKSICPDLILVPQKPEMYRRAHNALVAEIHAVIPIDTVKSIDELACRLGADDIADPYTLAQRIKRAIRYGIGASITCSMGFAANRHLAKIACAVGKPDGCTVWRPQDMPGPLIRIPLEDVPGVGRRMAQRLAIAGVETTEGLLRLAPKEARALWRNVSGERLWYALHGYAIEAPPSQRGMFGHMRVLPPEGRTLPAARDIARLLAVKAARRMRREGYTSSLLMLHASLKDGWWGRERVMRQVQDDAAVLQSLLLLWSELQTTAGKSRQIFRVGVTLGALTPAGERQLDLLDDDDDDRQRWERLGRAIDGANAKFGRTLVSVGPWDPPKGGNVGGKISFTRIPSAEDFA